MTKTKKIIIWTLIITILISLQGFFLMYLYKDDIKNIAVSQLNKQLNTPIKVGKIHFSIFEHFPYASISFPEVEVLGSDTSAKNNLLVAKDISLLFNIWDLFNKSYHIKKLYLEDADLDIQLDSLGKPNYSIWKETKQTSNQFDLSIDEIIFKNTKIQFRDKQNKKVLGLLIHKGNSKGKFNERQFELSTNIISEIKIISFGKIVYITNKEAEIQSNIAINLDKSIYQINELILKLTEGEFRSKGLIRYSDNQKDVQLKIEGEDLSLNTFILLLPKKQQLIFKNYKSKGDFSFQSSINGSIAEQHTPHIDVIVGLKDGSLTFENEKIKTIQLNNINFTLNFNNGKNNSFESSQIIVNSFKSNYEGNNLAGKFSCTNFNKPYIQLQIETNVPVIALQKLIPEKTIQLENGRFSINATFKGFIDDFKNDNRIEKTSAEGKVILTKVDASLPNSTLKIKNLSGDFNFYKNDLRINQLNAAIGKSDIQVNGYFRNLISFFLFPNQDLEIEAKLNSKNIYLDELLSSTPTSNSENDYLLKINHKLKTNLKLSINKLHFNKFTADDLAGEIKINNQIISTDYLSFRAQQGLVFSKLTLNASNQDKLILVTELNLKQINIQQLFYEFNDFGLNIIKSTNIKGQLSAALNINSTWNKYLQINLKDLNASGPILIENGELINFEPMLALSKYIDINELKNLKFETLENNLSIKDKTVFIPLMKIKSNAINLDLSGTHNFENMIDYRIKILLSDILKKKSKKLGDEQFGEIEDDGRGKTTLYLRMYGNANNPKFSFDKIGIKQKLSSDLKNEGKAVKQVLKDEFNSWFNKENEFNEQTNPSDLEWENDIPVQKNQEKEIKPVTSKSQTDSVKKKKTALQKLKEKLNEPIPEEQP